MKLLFTLIGIIAGGMMFHFHGALTGGLLVWLLCSQSDLRQQQEALKKELAWLRGRLAEQFRIEDADLSPESRRQPERSFTFEADVSQEMVQQNDSDIIHDEPWTASSGYRNERDAGRVENGEQPFTAKPAESSYAEDSGSTGPETPSAFESWIRSFVNGENLLVKLGVAILFIGVSFLLKYAAQRGLFPIELRLTATALGGCAMLATGWRLRDKRPVYAQVIQGGGIGILYLTTYATMNLYHLISAGPGFVLLVMVCALSVVLAVLQDSRTLAAMGCAGGFMAPQLASIGGSNPALLFGYYAVLNGGILTIASQRAWRELNLIGFVGTFIVSALWGERFYRPEFFFTVEPFLILFFLIYAAVPVLHARRQAAELEGYLDITLIFGTPILAFAFQSALVQQYQYGLAWSALAAAIFYITLAGRLFRAEPDRMRNLAEAFLALGTLFGTLAVPLAFEGRWTSAAWSIEGAALVWVGLRQERRLARAFGYLLLICSGVLFIGDDGLRSGVWPVLNSSFIGVLLISGAALFTARQLGCSKNTLEEPERYAEPVLFAWGMLWWFGGGLNEVNEHALNSLTFGATLLFISASCLACNYLRKRLDWHLLEWPAFALLPAMSILVVQHFLCDYSYPSLQGGWFGWPPALTAWYLILHGNRQRQPQLPAIVHAAPFWLMSLLAAWELSGRITHHLPGMGTWAFCAWGVVPALMVLLIARHGSRLPWPVVGNLSSYLGLGSAPLTLSAWFWLLCANLTHSGNPWPLPYLPLLNPLDLATLLVLISLFCWYRTIQGSLLDLAQMLPQREAIIALAATGFIWLNAILLRSIHHWCSVPFTTHDLFASLTVQTTLSICWCLLALTATTLATRRGLRLIWQAGAGLLGVVVAKLFLVDLSGHGSVARIISFVVVGLLILLIGWFSPVPPRKLN